MAAGASAAGFLATRTPAKAQAPWELAGSYSDPRKNALSYALLAPNPHNLQPWQVALEGGDALTLSHDGVRNLPHTDPDGRQIKIGMGCFLEQMVIAASAAGYDVDLTLFPEGPAGPIARAVFAEGAQTDPLAEHILARRSCKKPFTDQAVPAAHAEALRSQVDVYTDPAMVAAIQELSFDAFMVETLTPRTMKESVDLMRMGKVEINATPDGIDMGGAFLESLMLTGMLSRDALLDPDNPAFSGGIDSFRELMLATPAYAVLTTAGNNALDHIEAGRRWLRLNLTTTGMGLSLHPISQALQEYPEMQVLYAKAHEMLAPKGHTVQMLGRLGYGPEIPRTPRWPLEAKLARA
ncbi:Twin-arginine translocation pathway signal sequence domain protein [Sulfitobacter noctilucicola]|nr:Twin-arginine translocation pathway signal sequence domain protein [Sulfitobacter noctilucicola]